MANYPLIISGASCDPDRTWDRPCDWLDLPTITASDDKIAMLIGVRDTGDDTYLAIKVTADTGTIHVVWGDGTTEDLTSGVVQEHAYTFASLGDETSEGYRQVVCVVTANTGVITEVDYNVNPAGVSRFVQPTLQIMHSTPSLTSLVVGPYSPSDPSLPLCKSISLLNIGTVTSLEIRTLPSLLHANLNMQNVTSGQWMMPDCLSLAVLDLYNYENVTSFHGVAQRVNLKQLDLPDFTGSSIVEVLNTCRAAQWCNINCVNVTDASGAFYRCSSITSLILTGLKVSVDLSDCALGHNALETFYDNCGDPATPQTITATNNPGALTADDSGLHPNWTVVKT